MSRDDGGAAANHQPLLVLVKITEILDAFSLARPSLTLGEIQQATGFPTSTVQRLVTNMVAQGLLDRAGDQIRIVCHYDNSTGNEAWMRTLEAEGLPPQPFDVHMGEGFLDEMCTGLLGTVDKAALDALGR